MAHPLKPFLDAINLTKKNVLNEENEGEYKPFVINLCLARVMDAARYVQEMNQRPYIDKQMHFDFLRFALPKRSRFGGKIEQDNDAKLELIQKFFGYNRRRAYEVLDLITSEDLDKIKESLNTGGLSKREKAK